MVSKNKLVGLFRSANGPLDERAARKLTECGVPCLGCTPNRLSELIEGVLKKRGLKALAARLATKKKE